MENVRLLVGLGNPGSEYARTRHNAGFALVERLAREWQAAWRTESRHQARLAESLRYGLRLWLCQPLTYMNASGETVASLVGYYRLPLAQVLVTVDDADLPLGELRMRPGGGAGGHHGLESIEQHVGTSDYPRLRLGIGRRAAEAREITGYVLGRFTPEEDGIFDQVLVRAVDAATCWAREGIQPAMNRFNGALDAPKQRTAE